MESGKITIPHAWAMMIQKGCGKYEKM